MDRSLAATDRKDWIRDNELSRVSLMGLGGKRRDTEGFLTICSVPMRMPFTTPPTPQTCKELSVGCSSTALSL